MTQADSYQQGMADAYDLMDRTITGAIRRNEGAKSALQIINVFNEFTSHLHYQKSLLKDAMEREAEATFASKEPIFATEEKELEALLKGFGIHIIKGGSFQ